MKLVFSTVLFSLLFGVTSVSAAWDEGEFGLRGGNGKKPKSFMLLGGEGGGETRKPTEHPTLAPTHQPTPAPTNPPTESPTDTPTTVVPTPTPSEVPSTDPTNSPTQPPSSPPTTKPTTTLSESPSLRPSSQPTMNPSESPSLRPSTQPTMKPTTTPSESPSVRPSYQPTNQATPISTNQATPVPTNEPTPVPTLNPTYQPTPVPTKPPTEQPIPDPTSPPTMASEEECLSVYNQDICMKMERLAGAIGQQEVNIVDNIGDIIITGQEGDPGDITNLIEEFNTVIKQWMKELRPVDQHKQNFKDVALTAMAEANGKDTKEMLLEIASGLDSADMRERIITDVHNGYSVPEEGVSVDPTAGSEEVGFPDFFVEDPSKTEYIEELGHPGNRRHLGVPLKTHRHDRWPSATIKYYVVMENNGYNTWFNYILPAMNELEQETGLTFKCEGGVRDVSQATEKGKLYVMNKYDGCWAHLGYNVDRPRSMNIGSGCESKGIVLHELLHVAGMMHQHQACYRDKYITVHDQWIQPGWENQFDPMTCVNHGYEQMYDYGSIMHYGEYAATKILNVDGVEIRGDKTIDCQGLCGQREGLTYFDRFELMLYYNNVYGVNTGLRDGLGPLGP